jgi:glycosyltransferase involved in cell wall biosynthesis
MMTLRGHTVIHYGHERSEVCATEHVTVTNDEILKKSYGDYDWHSTFFKNSIYDIAHSHFNQVAALEVSKRKKKGDFLLLFWGSGHAHIKKVHEHDMIVVEPGIGCFNELVAPFRVFESYSVMNHVYGKYGLQPNFMDAVIPSYFDKDDFIRADESIDAFIARNKSHNLEGSLKLDDALKAIGQKYVLMVCRVIPDKGVYLAIDACKRKKIKLIIVGQGSLIKNDNVTYGSNITENADVCHVGYAEPRERAILMCGATAVMMPTLYSEPFGFVAVEAQMSGCPIITTDWGAFAETVQHGVTGFRCRTMEQFTWAIENVKHLDKTKIRSWAESNYGFQKVSSMFEEYFSMLSTLIDKNGFYADKPERLSLKWLEKQYM